MFGAGHVGFICINTKVMPKESHPGKEARAVPGYIFIRGDAVAVLVIVKEKETGKKHALLVR